MKIDVLFFSVFIFTFVLKNVITYRLARRLDAISIKKPGWYPYFHRLSNPLAYYSYRSIAEGETEEIQVYYKRLKRIRNWSHNLLVLGFLAYLGFKTLSHRYGWRIL